MVLSSQVHHIHIATTIVSPVILLSISVSHLNFRKISLTVRATRSLIPLASTPSITQLKPERSIVGTPLSHTQKTNSLAPPLLAYRSSPFGLYVAFLSLKPHIQKTHRPASQAACSPFSTSVRSYLGISKIILSPMERVQITYTIKGEVVSITTSKVKVLTIKFEGVTISSNKSSRDLTGNPLRGSISTYSQEAKDYSANSIKEHSI